jgi:FMN phosphatase YigB (HAD superfamily)
MKEKIKKILRENTEEKITKISIFDFDGTLIDTPEPETGKTIYKEKTGNDWPFKGWWGRNEGLDMDVFDIKPIQKVVSDYNEEKVRPNTKVIMMTGRIPKNSEYVEKILNTYNLKFDEYIYKKASETLKFKIGKLDEMLETYPNLRELEMWEDRPEHTKAFREWGSNKNIDVVINQV